MDVKSKSKTSISDLLIKFRIPLSAIVLFGLIVLGLNFFMILTKEAGNSINSAMTTAIGVAPEIAKNFRSGKITKTFREYITSIESPSGNNLEVANCERTESFVNDEEAKTWWFINLGTNVIEIKLTATFRYFIDINNEWKLKPMHNVCVVYAPEIQAYSPPAIHTDKMEKRIIKRGWARFDGQEQLDEIEKGITPKLIKRATDPIHITQIKDTARNKIEDFAKNWLLEYDQWKEDAFMVVKVVFPDERAEFDKVIMENYRIHGK